MGVGTPGATRASGDAWISWLICGRRAIPARPCNFAGGDLIAGSDVIRGHPQRAAGLGGLKPWSATSPPAPVRTGMAVTGHGAAAGWRPAVQLGRSTNLRGYEQVDLKVPKRKLEAGAMQPDRFRGWLNTPKLSPILQTQRPFTEFWRQRQPWAIKINKLANTTFFWKLKEDHVISC